VKFTRSAIKRIINYFDQTGDSKITFNEFALMLTPTLRPPKIEDLPRIMSYSPRKEVILSYLIISVGNQ